MIYYEACIHQEDASRREKYLKSYHGRMFFKKETQILFNRVNLVFQFRIRGNPEPLLEEQALIQQQRIDVGAFPDGAYDIMAR